VLISDGIPTKEDLAKITPSDERFWEGPVVIVECFQEIPCNPCVKACKRGAITMPHDINDVPVVNYKLCNGCGHCISLCPGLAIFVVDKTYSDDFALVKLPYEYVPVPQAGQRVTALSRAGEDLGSFEVVKVSSGGMKNMTYTISLVVPQEMAMEVRDVRVK
jgi:Fe-S-cluster-containing hydrogenase component 2